MILFSVAIVAATAQVDVTGKVKNQTNNRANNKVDQSINKGLDKIEEGIGGMFKKKKTEDTQQSDQTQQQPENGVQNTASAGSATPSLQSYSKYDFVPGDRIILYEDFSQDAIGDFPALWTTNKSGEVNTLNIASGNWFNLNETEGNWWFLKEIDYPENYIVEFDVIPKNQGGRYAVGLHLYGENSYSEMSDPYEHVQSGLVITVSTDGWEAKGFMNNQQQINGSSDLNPVHKEKLSHVILWVQKRRVRIYHEGAKVLDLPTLLYQGSKFNRLCFELYRGASCSSFISNLKITTASPDTRSKLLTEGKLVSYGIYFDVNKDIVKPESYGALNDIAKVLKENPTVRVKISGHTDSDGDDALNLALSKRRGASVKNELVNTFGIEAAQLETDGMGESQPVAPNDTPVNKALNRRVEFIKL
jgi:flagellar motor protein MotB